MMLWPGKTNPDAQMAKSNSTQAGLIKIIIISYNDF